jgi:hypothetical protein
VFSEATPSFSFLVVIITSPSWLGSTQCRSTGGPADPDMQD